MNCTEENMFCFQCQETARNQGCTRIGVCGKTPETAAMQDLLIYVTKGLSVLTTQLREEGKPVDPQINHLITTSLFSTITNANFDVEDLCRRIEKTLAVKDELLMGASHLETLPDASLWSGSREEFDQKAASAKVGVLATENEDIRSLRELITYGLKGLAAYTKHANALLHDNEEVDAFIQKALAKTLDDTLSVDDLVALTLETGKYGVQGMAALDEANTSTYGHPDRKSVV